MKTNKPRPTANHQPPPPQQGQNDMPRKLVHSIVHWDCLEKLPKIPDGFIDFVCADFPYNISGRPGLTMRGNKVVRSDFGEWDKWPSQEEYLEFVFEVCRQLHRVMKPNASAVLFFWYRQMGWIAYELERRGLFTFRQPIVFRKENPLPSIRKNGFRSCMETGVWLVKDGGAFNRPCTFNFLGQDKMTSIWPYKIGIDGGKASKHPTEKPLWLTGRLVRIFSDPGDIVLDCFAGSGTTGIAAFKLWRNAISIEREAEFIDMIKARQAEAERKRKG